MERHYLRLVIITTKWISLDQSEVDHFQFSLLLASHLRVLHWDRKSELYLKYDSAIKQSKHESKYLTCSDNSSNINDKLTEKAREKQKCIWWIQRKLNMNDQRLKFFKYENIQIFSKFEN